MLKLSISYLLALMIVFQSFLAIADVHQTESNTEFHQVAAQQHNIEVHELQSAEFSQHEHNEQQNNNHVECHHGHCHHASVVFLVKTAHLLNFTQHSNEISQDLLWFISLNISPDLRPPIS